VLEKTLQDQKREKALDLKLSQVLKTVLNVLGFQNLIKIAFTQLVLKYPDNTIRELLGIPIDGVRHWITLYHEQIHNVRSVGHPFLLCAEDEIVLTLVHLRHYPRDVFLGAVFGISKQTANNIHQRVKAWLYQILQPELSFHSLEWRKDHGAVNFWNNQSLLTFIVDGAEQETGEPENLQLNTLYYSAKKAQFSMNVLLWVALDGTVLKLSSTFPGIRNDPVMLEATDKAWLNQLNNFEFGFGDGIFANSQEYHIYTLKERKTQAHRNFSHFRIQVEQSIEKIKNFAVCSSKLRTKTNNLQAIAFHHQSWTIIAALVNRYCF